MSGSELTDPNEIVQTFSQMNQNLQQFTGKMNELEADFQEHTQVWPCFVLSGIFVPQRISSATRDAHVGAQTYI